MTCKFAIGAFLVSLTIAGCAGPAARGTQAASNTATASTGTTPSVSPTTPSTTPLPTGTAAPSLAFEVPADFLPPWAFVEVAVDNLQLRAEPGLSAAVVGTAPAGQRYQIAYEFGPVVVDGLDWYRLATMGDAVIWAAAGSGADRYLELVPPDCPEADPDLSAAILIAQWDRLACFGDRSLTFEGTYACQGCGGTSAGDFNPWWLAYPLNFDLLWPNYQSRTGYLEMRIPPESGLERPEHGSIVRVTGHFSDPASSTCSMSTFDGERAFPVDSRTAEVLCRERFVVDGFDVLGTDPDFP